MQGLTVAVIVAGAFVLSVLVKPVELPATPDASIETCLMIGGVPSWEATRERARFSCDIPGDKKTNSQSRRILT